MSRFISFLAVALVSCGMLLTIDGDASARGHRGGGHGGYDGGHSVGDYGGYHHGGFAYGPSVFLGGYPYWGGYSSYYYDGGTYSQPQEITDASANGSYPSYYYEDGGRYSSPETVIERPYSESYYESPAPMPYAEQRFVPNLETAGVTSIRVIKPTADAAIWMDGRRTESPTDTHIFEFSNEPVGKMYMHKIKVAWNRDGKPMTAERQVQIGGGKSSVVDFNRPAPKTPSK